VFAGGISLGLRLRREWGLGQDSEDAEEVEAAEEGEWASGVP
jgi:hypothetical protein